MPTRTRTPKGKLGYPASVKLTPEDLGLLKSHLLHKGLYRCVAQQVGVDATLVNRVAHGKRKSDKIMSALLEELRSIQPKEPQIAAATLNKSDVVGKPIPSGCFKCTLTRQGQELARHWR
jgi:diacylglycerol kinase family enzyme